VSADNVVRLRLHSGVPIVDVLGEWAPHLTDSLTEMISSLIVAGHFEIVLNVKRTLGGVQAIMALGRNVQAVRKHCGHIDLVVSAEQRDELVRQQAQRVFRLATTEETAIARIKRVPVLSIGHLCTAKPRL
jgi:hypothetical protein